MSYIGQTSVDSCGDGHILIGGYLYTGLGNAAYAYVHKINVETLETTSLTGLYISGYTHGFAHDEINNNLYVLSGSNQSIIDLDTFTVVNTATQNLGISTTMHMPAVYNKHYILYHNTTTNVWISSYSTIGGTNDSKYRMESTPYKIGASNNTAYIYDGYFTYDKVNSIVYYCGIDASGGTGSRVGKFYLKNN